MKKHRNTRNKRKKYRKLIILSVISFLCIMSAGYAAFQTHLNIAAKGNIKEMSAAEYLKRKVTTSNDGLYTDKYEDNRYIYKGKDPNNYITFNDELWRIISIESTGNLKIMRNNSIGNRPFDVKGARQNGYCGLVNDPSPKFSCNSWAKTENFINGTFTGLVEKDASLNIYLNNDYYGTILENDKIKIINGIFNTGPLTHDYSNPNIPLMQSKQEEKQQIWKGKIAIPTMIEYIEAGIDCKNVYATYYNSCAENNWLYDAAINSNSYTWLLSIWKNISVINFNIVPKGYVREGDFNGSGASYAIFPTLYLNSDIKISGEGTESNPYKIYQKNA